MKLFMNKNIIHKLIISIDCITVLNFCFTPVKVHAVNVGGVFANGAKPIA